MKKFILSALVMLLITGSADAQSRRNNNQRNQQFKRNDRQSNIQTRQMKGQLYSQLNMSSFQRVQADRLNQDLVSGLQNMRTNNKLSRQQKKMAINNMVQQHQYGFTSLLSPSQSQQYSSLFNNGSVNQLDLGSSGIGSLLGDYGWLVDLLGSNLNVGSLLGGNFDLGSLLGLFTR